MLNNTLQTFAGLQCRVLDLLPEGQSPTQLIVVCHGFGASMDDLASFAPYLFHANSTIPTSCRFVFPNAPMDLGPLGMPGGRAWWEINMARLADINHTKNYQQLTSVVPDGLLESSQQLADAVREMQTTFSMDDGSTTLAGFSQGAMIATDLVLRHGFVPRRLCVFSGMLICEADWKVFAERHPGCPILQSHGRHDMVLPFEPATSLRDMLIAAGFDVTFVPFNADHTIPIEVLDQWAELL